MTPAEQRAEHISRQIIDGTPSGRWYLEGWTDGYADGLTQGRSEGYARGIRLLEDMKAAGVYLGGILRAEGYTSHAELQHARVPADPPRPVPTVDQCLASWGDGQVSAA